MSVEEAAHGAHLIAASNISSGGNLLLPGGTVAMSSAMLTAMGIGLFFGAVG